MKYRHVLMVFVALLVVTLAVAAAACCPPATPSPTPTPTPEATPGETPEATPAETPEGTPGETPAAGTAPTLATGDQWVWSVTYGAQTNTYTEVVTGEEQVDSTMAYSTEITIDPDSERLYSGIDATISGYERWLDTENLDEIKSVMPIEAMGMTITATIESTVTHATAKWPLAVGTTWTVERTTTVNPPLASPSTVTRTVTVEAEEDVTVPAGTFTCFKIVTTEGGEVVKTEWFSGEVKNNVKVIDTAFGEDETWELTSYTVAE